MPLVAPAADLAYMGFGGRRRQPRRADAIETHITESHLAKPHAGSANGSTQRRMMLLCMLLMETRPAPARPGSCTFHARWHQPGQTVPATAVPAPPLLHPSTRPRPA